MANAEPVRFDLATGRVETDAGERLVLVPLPSFDELVEWAGPDVASRFARGIGASIGRRIASRLGHAAGVRGASLEGFVTEMALQMALSGWGSPSIERWGKALVVSVEHAPTRDRGVVVAFVEGALGAAVGTEVHGAALSADGSVRVLLTNATRAAEARGWTSDGVSAAEVIARLHGAPTGVTA
jgi:hypothetical protein